VKEAFKRGKAGKGKKRKNSKIAFSLFFDG
jgi:hypothetical protein